MPSLFAIHFTLTAFMTGFIWLIQCVHYPAFHWISPLRYHEFCKFHVKHTTFIVAPVMIAEAITGFFICVYPPKQIPLPALWANLGFLALIWLSTQKLSVPLHQKLASAYDAQAVDQLVATNWPRTVLWTLRCLGLLFFAESL